MGSVVIIVRKPFRKHVKALLVGLVGPGGLVGNPERGAHVGERAALRVAKDPVGEDALDLDAAPRKEAAGPPKKAGRGLSPLVDKHLHVACARTVIHGHVQEMRSGKTGQ